MTLGAPMSGRTTVRTLVVAVLGVLAACGASPVQGQGAPPAGTAALRVGTLHAPPFAMRDDEGEWTGIAIDLWREVARRQNLTYRFEEYDLAQLFDALEGGRIDVAVGPLLMTAEREQRVDLTIPFMHVALAIATRPMTGWRSDLRALLTAPLVWFGLVLSTLLTLFAVLVWLFERHRNPHFGGGAMRGMGDAIWWSASTMTTVGYGDRTPVTFWGRALGIVWMVVSIFLVSAFIAAVSSSLTLRRLQSHIRSMADLTRLRVGAVTASGSADYLRDLGITPVGFETPEAAVRAVLAGEVDAIVDEWPILHYLEEQRFPGRLAVIPQHHVRGFVAFALRRDSPRRRALNVTILEVLDDPAWAAISRTYLGADDELNARAP